MNTMYKYRSVLFVTIMLGVVALSCRENFELDPGQTYPRLCVEGYMTTDTARHMVRLAKSRALNDTTPFQKVSDANVTISDGSNVYELKEDSSEKGTYYTDSTVYGVPGRTYTLSIKNVDVNNDGVMEEYSAQSQLYSVNPIDSFIIYYNNKVADMKGWSLNLYALDPGGRNFYLIKARRNGIMLSDSIYKFSFANNLGFEGQHYKGFQAYFIKENTSTKLVEGDVITLEMSRITEEYYNFIVDYITEYYPKIPIFSGPSANVSTNLSPKDKACGFFAAYSIQRKSRVYK